MEAGHYDEVPVNRKADRKGTLNSPILETVIK